MKKLKLDQSQGPIDFLRFEFTKTDDSIEVQYLSLQTPLKSFAKQEKKIKKTLRQSSIESVMKKNEVYSKKKSNDNEINVNEVYGLDDELIKQQERIKTLLPSNGNSLPKDSNGYKSEGYKIEGAVKSQAYNTRSSSKECKVSNSCQGLFDGKVVSALIEDKELRMAVVEVLEAFGAVYLEEPSDSCSFVVAEKVIGIEGLQEVTVKWLFECAEKREILPYE